MDPSSPAAAHDSPDDPSAGATAADRATTRLAAEVLELLGARGLTLATAESLTGGGLGEAITSVPGASAVYVGGVVSYATRIKVEVLDVPADLVAEHGVVSAECAAAMAVGAARLLDAAVAVSTTGVAGPDEQEGKPAGLVHVGVATPAGVVTQELRLVGDRHVVRAATVAAALTAVRAALVASS